MGLTFKTELTKLVAQLRPLFDALLDFIYPPFCLVCKRRLSSAENPVCAVCWSGLPLSVRRRGTANSVCAEASRITAIATVWEFCDEVQTIVHEYKYRKMRSLAGPIGGAMATLVRDSQDFRDAHVLVPVPLHNTKLRERGFNQSLLLAERISETLGMPVAADAVFRIRYTKSQSRLNVTQRQQNVTGAFALANGGAITGKRVIIVDDVFTTGATLNACAACLHEAQPAEILALTAANVL